MIFSVTGFTIKFVVKNTLGKLNASSKQNDVSFIHLFFLQKDNLKSESVNTTSCLGYNNLCFED